MVPSNNGRKALPPKARERRPKKQPHRHVEAASRVMIAADRRSDSNRRAPEATRSGRRKN
jgi:hypothetical protein